MNTLDLGFDLNPFSTEALVYLAMLGYVAGFLFRDQIILRVLMLFGTLFYIAYYRFHPEEPLWNAIYASTLIFAANLIGLSRLLYSRMEIAIPHEQRLIYNSMKQLRPGEFRRLMRIGEIVAAEEDTVLTREGETPDHLYFVFEGAPRAVKSGHGFAIPLDHFIGDVSFVTSSNASADVILPAGGRYVRWDKARLRRELARSSDFERAFEALISYDLAFKVATSVNIGQRPETVALSKLARSIAA